MEIRPSDAVGAPVIGPPEPLPSFWRAAGRRVPIIACLVLILAASMSHVANAFGAYERPTAWPYWGWLAAVGIDAMIAVLMWRLMSGRRLGGDGWALAGVVLASTVSAQANLAHALAVAVERNIGVGILERWVESGFWQVAAVLTVSVTLPVFVGILAAVAHGDSRPSAKLPVPPMPTATWPTAEPAPAWAAFADANYSHRSPAKRQGKTRMLAVAAADAARLAAVQENVRRFGLRPDAVIADATGVPRSTVGYWRRAGKLPAGAESGLLFGAAAPPPIGETLVHMDANGVPVWPTDKPMPRDVRLADRAS